MKKTIVALLALSSLAMAENVRVINSNLAAFEGDTHAADRLDFDFAGSTDRTVSITTTGDATILNSDGYGLRNDEVNHLIFNITGTLTVTGKGGAQRFKGTGSTNAASTVEFYTSLSDAEVQQIVSSIGTAGTTVSRDLITVDFFESLTPSIVSVTLNNLDTLEYMTYGGMLVKVNQSGNVSYYNVADVTADGSGYWTVATDAAAVTLEVGKAYGYVMLTANSGAAPKAIGFVAAAPEPATATLSLLALAGLASRRRRH